MSGPGCAVGGGPPASRPRRSLLLVAPLAFRVPRVLCWAGLRRGRRPAREPSAPRAWLGASTRCPARPRRRPRAPQPGLRSSGALHAGGACAVVSHLEARLGSAAHGHRSQACVPPAPFTPAVRLVLLCVAPSCLLLSNFARNSPVTISEFELASLELQRFWAVFKSDRGKLRADLVSPRLCRRSRAPQPRTTDSSHAAHTDMLLLSG